MKRRRVVITGLGVISSVGHGVATFTEAIRSGKSGISEIRSFDTAGFPITLGGEVQDFVPSQWLKRLPPSKAGRTSQFAAAAARMAVEDAAMDPLMLEESSVGVCVGTTSGESQLLERLTAEWVQEGPEALSSELVTLFPANRLALAVNQELGLSGEATTLSTACSAGNYAIGHAYDLIQTGEVDFALCGGADSVCRWVHAGFYRLGAITPSFCQPFDRNRQGILTGEGSGMLFLESLESAQARNARVYAEVLGYGLNCDANHMVAPDPMSVAACMRLAHQHASVHPDQIDYICAHGTGTRVNDAVETTAIRSVFKDRLPPTSSIKSMLGHTMGAASALGAMACSLAIYHGFIPPTINFSEPDPECGEIDCVPNQARTAHLNVVQNNGFAFGGNNAVTVFGRPTWVSQHLH